ncbi:MAG TPA: endonuclease/exonuclease/phosphatase family protein [Labilithrix sp.]|nr:endonuclease/exonuclease/phosphatase family protein [Labilithrix sp.]
MPVPSKKQASEHTPAERTQEASTEPVWKRRGRALLYWLIVLQMFGVVLFIGGLYVAEATRPTFMALYTPRQPLIVVSALALLLAPVTRRRVRALVVAQIVLCLIVLFPVMGLHLNLKRSPEKKAIRLVSYNVYFGKLDRVQLMNELAAMDVDILLIQAPHESMAARLRERFPDRSVEHIDDLIVVSRFKLREVIKPERIDKKIAPMYASYVVETDMGPLGIYNVHPYSPRHALFGGEMAINLEQRERQIEAAVLAAKADGAPYLVVGDTNLPPWSAIGRRHFEGLTDAFEDVGFGFGYTFPAKRPWMRIDRAFGSEGIRFLNVRVGPLGASDHRPIFVDFEIVKRR